MSGERISDAAVLAAFSPATDNNIVTVGIGTVMKSNPLLKLRSLGQSIWLDWFRRGMLTSGELKNILDEDGISGVTLNSLVFERVVAGSHDYDEIPGALALRGKTAEDIYWILAIHDAQQACDLLRPIYDRTNGQDGLVSLDILPRPVHDTSGILVEAREMWADVDRPNLMVRVPGTSEALPAIQQLLSEGINVHITRLFSLSRYQKVAEAYLAGLEMRLRKGQPLAGVVSVAGFLVSQVDVFIDYLLEKIIRQGGPQSEIARSIQGRVAVAIAKNAYRAYRQIYHSDRFRRLSDHSATPQRLLWASMSTKSPGRGDVMYVDSLIGPETITTLSGETLHAYRDHGSPAVRLPDDLEGAEEILCHLSELGIDLDEVVQQLRDESIDRFFNSFDRLAMALQLRPVNELEKTINRQVLALGRYHSAVRQRINALEQAHFGTRLWRKDSSLWKVNRRGHKSVRDRLGWLHLVENMEPHLPRLAEFVDEVAAAGFRHVVYLGTNANSLVPMVFKHILASRSDGLRLTVLDTNDPANMGDFESSVSLARTLFIVASKSGTDPNPLAFAENSYSRLTAISGGRAGRHFVAISDFGTPLTRLAETRDFRRVFVNFRDVDERYAALSYFDLVPAALMGLDVNDLLARAMRMQDACASCVPLSANPAVVLGAVLGELALQGRNKVTFLLPKSLVVLGSWLKRLFEVESSDESVPLIPVVDDHLHSPMDYGGDRLFVYIHLRKHTEADLEQAVSMLRDSGQPVVTIEIYRPMDLGQEFLRWQMAAATAGAILGVTALAEPSHGLATAKPI